MIQRHYDQATQQKYPAYGHRRKGTKITKLLLGLENAKALIQASQLVHRLKDLILV